jgi:MFS family permease
MPIFAAEILHAGAGGLGILMGASGFGALIGALSLAARNKVHGLGRWVAISTAGFGASLILFSLSRSFWLSVALLLPVGFSMMIEMAASNTLIQAMVPDHLRGRVMAVYSMMFMGMAPIGALVAGALAHRLGAPRTVLIGGVVCVFGAAIFALRLPKLRDEGRRLIVALQMTGGSPAAEITGEASALADEEV